MYPPHCIMHWNIVFTWLQSKQDRSWLNILKLTCVPCVTLIFSREPATVASVDICNGCLSAPVCIKEQISDWRYNLWPGVCLKCKNWWQRTDPRPLLPSSFDLWPVGRTLHKSRPEVHMSQQSETTIALFKNSMLQTWKESRLSRRACDVLTYVFLKYMHTPALAP